MSTENQNEELKKDNQTDVDASQPQSQTIKLSDEEAIRAYVNDPQIKEDHLKIAQQLHSVFESRWFTVDTIANKTLMKDKKDIMQMMVGLQLFNMVTAAEGGVNYQHQTKFKITLTIEDKLKVLRGNRDSTLKQLDLIDQAIEKLLQEQSAGEDNQE